MSEHKTGWSRWYSWPLNRAADAIPENIKPGDWIDSDLAVRPHMAAMAQRLNRPAIYSSLVWQVDTGGGFQLAALAVEKPCTHCVLSRYRIWEGEGPPLEEVAEEHDYLQELMDRPDGPKQKEIA